MPNPSFQAPTGTRDFYPAELLRRRFIMESWRRASLIHGFEEIDGPTFEHLDLYTVKSGEGIVSELFSFERAGGEKTYALRAEFTPTLARLFAARAGALPRPTKWFSLGNFFRAERPQRGRLREFWQWNADIVGDASPAADAEIIACCVRCLAALGLTPRDVRVKVNHRAALGAWLAQRGLPPERHGALFKLLDQRGKIPDAQFASEIATFGFSPEQAEIFARGVLRVTTDPATSPGSPLLTRLVAESGLADDPSLDLTYFSEAVAPLATQLALEGILDWIDFDLSIVRGIAYYTGMVFEVHEASGAERAIAGGGRYDNLIELFDGPPTPAVGFGMGDVVVSLVLQDRGLFPDETALAQLLGARPDVFVVSNGTPEGDAAVIPTIAALRARGVHARRSYRATKNVGKLLQEASKNLARFAVLLESDTRATIKDLTTGAQAEAPIERIFAIVTGAEALAV